jgi:hypothetical protein
VAHGVFPSSSRPTRHLEELGRLQINRDLT